MPFKDKQGRIAIRGRIWIDGPEGIFFGSGRALLLERIKEHGSITRAAKSMKMAYRHAWDLVDAMNRQAKEPLVELATGGKGGGGARVTAAGERAIRQFRALQEDFQAFLARERKKLVAPQARSSHRDTETLSKAKRAKR